MLSVKNIEVVYSGVIRAVRDVSLEVPDKSVVTLLGPNGAGKTSIFRAISGILSMENGKLAAGSIYLDDERLDGLDPYKIIRRGVVQVPEGRRIFANLTVDENLRMGGYSRRDPAGLPRTYDYVFSLFPQLVDKRKQAAGYLSGGEQQMLAIGRALMAKPRLLLMDEPSLGLGPILVQQIAEIITQINTEGTAVLLVEQNVPMALSIAGYVYIMATGQVMQEGPAKGLLDDEEAKSYYFGLNETERKRDFGRFKDREIRLAERALRKV